VLARERPEIKLKLAVVTAELAYEVLAFREG